MNELVEDIDKKGVVRYKSILKKMLTTVSKFGSSKEKDDVVRLYHFIDENKNIHPVLFLFQDVNPWGSEFYPSKLFIVATDFPTDIDIFNTFKNKYTITKSMMINVASVKKHIDTLKNLSIVYKEDGCHIDIPHISMNDEVDHYVDMLTIKSVDIKHIVKCKNSYIVTDKDYLEQVYATLLDETTVNITSTNGSVLRLFYSIFPIKMDMLEYSIGRRIIYVSGNHGNINEVTNVVYSKQRIGDIVINNFYKYVDSSEQKVGQ